MIKMAKILRGLGRSIHLFLLGLVLISALVTNGYVGAYAVCGDCMPLLAMLNHIDYVMLVGGLGGIIGALVVGRRWLVLAFVPVMLVFGWWYGPHFIPQPRPQAQGVVVRVATYNTQYNASWPATIYENIRALDADVIGLQEVGPLLQPHLIQFAEPDYPHLVLHDSTNRSLALLSRYPILEVQRVGQWFEYIEISYIRAVLDIEGQPVAVYVFHAPTADFLLQPLYYDDTFLMEQTQAMVGVVNQEMLPFVVLCDCNTTPRSRPYSVWRQVADEAFGAVGRGFGHSFKVYDDRFYSFPIIRIDYVWHSGHFRPLSARVWPNSATSDHHPLVSELDLRS